MEIAVFGAWLFSAVVSGTFGLLTLAYVPVRHDEPHASFLVIVASVLAFAVSLERVAALLPTIRSG